MLGLSSMLRRLLVTITWFSDTLKLERQYQLAPTVHALISPPSTGASSSLMVS